MEGTSVRYIEQNLLPFSFRIGQSVTFEESCRVIRAMNVRGAGAIGALAGFAMAQAASVAPETKYHDFLSRAKATIESTRPTARNLFHAVDLVFQAALVSREEAIREATGIADTDARDSRLIGEYGTQLLRNGMNIETHCNAGWLAFVDYGTALSPIYQAHQQGKNLFVYVDETRPRGQGARLTAWELFHEGIPHAIIPDNAGAYFMSLGKVDLMIVGADRVAANGDVANKIGTLEKAIAARAYGIPFYVAAPTSTFDLSCADGSQIPIEFRDESEILFQEGLTDDGRKETIRVCSPGSTALNPAFDVTPARFITGIITEKGIITPSPENIQSIKT